MIDRSSFHENFDDRSAHETPELEHAQFERIYRQSVATVQLMGGELLDKIDQMVQVEGVPRLYELCSPDTVGNGIPAWRIREDFRSSDLMRLDFSVHTPVESAPDQMYRKTHTHYVQQFDAEDNAIFTPPHAKEEIFTIKDGVEATIHSKEYALTAEDLDQAYEEIAAYLKPEW